MSRVIEMLRYLDRKERFAVLREALGFDRETPRLDDGFRNELSKSIGISVPERAFLAADYHPRLDRVGAPTWPDARTSGPERISKTRMSNASTRTRKTSTCSSPSPHELRIGSSLISC